MRYLFATLLATIVAMGLGFTAPAVGDDELDAHLTALQKQLDDASIPLAQREQIALEMASALDRAAQTAPTPELRRERWGRAVEILDRFRGDNREHPQAGHFQLQAAIYLWARSRSWEEEYEHAPRNTKARDQAIANLDGAIARLRDLRVQLKEPAETFGQNVRYRLAQALADRAALAPDDSDERLRLEDEAVKALDPAITQPSLRGFAELLRADVLARLGLYGEAFEALDNAIKADPAPSEAELLETRVAILIRHEDFADALKVIDGAKVGDGFKGLLVVRTRLAQRADLPPGRKQSEVEAALFETLKTLRASGKPEARLALMSVARQLQSLDAEQKPEAWDLLAEGQLLLGEPGKAGSIEQKAAERAEALGDAAKAVEYQLRAGAYFFEAEQFAKADEILSNVLSNPKAGEARPKAGLLRALARGRALAVGQKWATSLAYGEALEAQVREFPNDRSTIEARWLLGQLKFARGEKDAAAALWSAIPPSSDRWLESRLAAARVNQDDLDLARITNDHDAVTRRYEAARHYLAESRAKAETDAGRSALDLARARLELTPAVGSPDEARRLCERVRASAVPPRLREQADRLYIVALAFQNRFVEAERAAQMMAEGGQPADMVETARLLDHAASESDSDLRLRRFGLLMKLLLAHAVERVDELPPRLRLEVQLRQSRALLLTGNTASAQRSLHGWAASIQNVDDGFLKDLADTYFRLDAFDLAVDVERLRVHQNPTGSPRWFQAKYGQALAYYRAGKEKEALHVIDATSILHPELGGGELQEKFVRLRQRLNPAG